MIRKRKIRFLLLITLLCGCADSFFYSIRTNSTDVLYKGVENKILIKSANTENLKVSVDSGTIRKIDSNLYVIEVGKTNPYTMLTIQSGRKTETLKFRNKRVPDPIAYIKTDSGGVKTNEVDAATFKTFSNVVCALINFDYNFYPMYVEGYKVMRVDSTGKIETREVKEAYKQSGRNATILPSKAQPGDIYIFTEIKVKYPTDEIRTAPDIVLKIR